MYFLLELQLLYLRINFSFRLKHMLMMPYTSYYNGENYKRVTMSILGVTLSLDNYCFRWFGLKQELVV